jgi:acetyltransferase-like isoleucine patch superfamily enzyme
MLRPAMRAVGRRVKNDSSFDVDDAIETRALVSFSRRRLAMALRGAWLTIQTGKWAFPVFVGRGVVVTNPQKLSLAPGVTLEDYCRLDCQSQRGVTLGAGATLRRGTHVEATSTLKEQAIGCEIGPRVGISEGCYIGAKGPVRIGADTDLGPGCKVIAENHSFDDVARPIRTQELTRIGITIGEDCWLGANVVVLDGCSVGPGAVVAAGAVVTKSLPKNCVAAGVPAQVVRYRGDGTSESDSLGDGDWSEG